MSRIVAALAAYLCAAACSPADGPGAGSGLLPPRADEAARLIDGGDLLHETTVLAADEMEGRGPGSEGDRRARRYLAGRLEALGLEPPFEDGSWHQPFAVVGVTARMPESWEFQAGDASLSFRFREEYMGASGLQRPEVAIDDAEVVFVGYGIEAPEEDWDDFAGEDLRGKVLLMLNDDPDWDPDLFAGPRKLYYGRWSYKYESAARQGAAGAVIVHTTPSAGYPWTVVRNSWSGEQFQLPAGDGPRTPLHAWLTEGAARRLVSVAGLDLDRLIERARSRDFRPIPLGVRTSLRFPARIRRTETANTGGLLRGSHAGLGREVVVYTAHPDHLGMDETGEGDRIYNGAVDNAVAMAQLLEIAEAFRALPEPPARSILFLLPAAEEQGLLGSKHFVDSGRFEPGRLAANINLELANVWGPTDDVVIFGRGKSTLEDLLEVLARRQRRRVTDEGDVRAGWYYRSDQFSFARAGVPAIWFRSGTGFRDADVREQEPFARWIEERYHQPGDEVLATWNLGGAVEDARLAFWLGLAVADAREMPAWVPGDEFEEIRRAALDDPASP